MAEVKGSGLVPPIAVPVWVYHDLCSVCRRLEELNTPGHQLETDMELARLYGQVSRLKSNIEGQDHGS